MPYPLGRKFSNGIIKPVTDMFHYKHKFNIMIEFTRYSVLTFGNDIVYKTHLHPEKYEVFQM